MNILFQAAFIVNAKTLCFIFKYFLFKAALRIKSYPDLCVYPTTHINPFSSMFHRFIFILFVHVSHKSVPLYYFVFVWGRCRVWGPQRAPLTIHPLMHFNILVRRIQKVFFADEKRNLGALSGTNIIVPLCPGASCLKFSLINRPPASFISRLKGPFEVHPFALFFNQFFYSSHRIISSCLFRGKGASVPRTKSKRDGGRVPSLSTKGSVACH